MTTARPRASDTPILKRAAKQLADNLCAELMKDCGSSQEVIAADIAKHAQYHNDGYQIARDLERYACWDCDLEIANELDSFSRVVSNIVHNLEKEWAAENNIQPPFPVGSHIRVSETETGIIDRVYEHGAAKYAVAIDGDPEAHSQSQRRRIVNFEDVAAFGEQT